MLHVDIIYLACRGHKYATIILQAGDRNMPPSIDLFLTCRKSKNYVHAYRQGQRGQYLPWSI